MVMSYSRFQIYGLYLFYIESEFAERNQFEQANKKIKNLNLFSENWKPQLLTEEIQTVFFVKNFLLIMIYILLHSGCYFFRLSVDLSQYMIQF